MSNNLYTDESDLKGLEITDEILDGIFPQEDIGEKTSLHSENSSSEKFIIDIYGRPQLIGDCEDVEAKKRVVPAPLLPNESGHHEVNDSRRLGGCEPAGGHKENSGKSDTGK
jgi:hypothetical protein